MYPDREKHSSDIVAAALKQDDGQREAYLRKACAGDSALYLEVIARINADAATRTVAMPPLKKALLNGRYRVTGELSRADLESSIEPTMNLSTDGR